MGLKRIPAYVAIYLLWGGSYLAVSVLVQIVPPFLVAGLRYSLAAILLVPLLLMRSDPVPTRRQVFNCLWTGAAMLTIGYGVVFWAERQLPSWIVAVLVSTTFLWTYLGESLVLRSCRFRGRMLLPLLAGLAVVPLLSRGISDSGIVYAPAVLAVLLGALSWSAGSLAVKRIDMPRSYIQTAALQLAASGLLLLCISGTMGEWRRLPAMTEILTWRLVAAMAYLVVGASMVAFVAFHWLLTREPASLVATSTYVNPVVAMLLGIGTAHERYSQPQLVGAMVLLGSIILIWHFQGSTDGFETRELEAIHDI